MALILVEIFGFPWVSIRFCECLWLGCLQCLVLPQCGREEGEERAGVLAALDQERERGHALERELGEWQDNDPALLERGREETKVRERVCTSLNNEAILFLNDILPFKAHPL